MISNTANIPFDITGGVIVGNISVSSNYTLSGFTNDLTKFKFNIINPIPEPPKISNDKFVWNLGDGTIVKGISAEHVYRIPGYYNVSLVAYSSAGEEYLSTVTQQVSVSDFYPTYIEHVSDDVFNTVKIYTGRLDGRSPTPIKVNRFTSWQPHGSLSSSAYTLQLYASGSSSKPLNLATQADKWRHVDQTWSFYNPVTANNKTVSYAPTSTTDTTSEEIYYKESTRLFDPGGIDDPYYVQQFVKVRSSKVPTTSGTVLVGTSGTADIYYSDDTATSTLNPILAFISLDVTAVPDVAGILNPGSSFSFTSAQYRAHNSITVPVRTIATPATKIKFTTTGLTTMPLTGSRWQLTSIPFFVNLVDNDDVIVENHPPLQLQLAIAGATPSTDTYVVNLSVVDSATKLLSANFHRYIDDQLPIALSGMYRGFFVPVDASDNAQLLADIKLVNPAGFLKDSTTTRIVNPQYNLLYTINLPNSEYAVNSTTGILERTLLSTSSTVASGDTLSIAIAPDNDIITDSRTTSYIADSTLDTVSGLDTYSTAYKIFNLRSIPIAATDTQDQTPKDLITLSTGSTTNLAPSNLALDKNRKLWITCHDASLTVCVDTSANRVISTIQHPGNVTYSSAATGTSSSAFSANSGFGGYNLIEPGIVDTDTDNNIWIAFTNPLSSFITKYDTSATTPAQTSKYEFPKGVMALDMVVDNSNNIWVATVNQLREARASITTNVSAYGSTQLRYYTGSNSLADWQVGEIVECDWSHTNRHFSGQGLITARADAGGSLGWYVDVVPYTGRMSQIYTSTSGSRAVESVTIKVYPSDKIYKFNSAGTKLAEVSGFYKPGYICVDSDQYPWIAHDSNTLTQIQNNEIYRNVRCETNEFLTSNASSDLLTFNSAQIGGICCDTFSRVLIINSYENRLIYVNTTTPSLSVTQPIDNNSNTTSNMFRGFGDWTGFRWLNKYYNMGAGAKTVTGATTLNIYPSDGKYKVAKINENFDPADTIKSYRFQPHLIDNKVFFDDFYGQIVGSLSGAPTDLGRVIYEKIANFSSNIADADTCNINAFYSLCDQINYTLNNYNFKYTGGLKRIIDIASIQHKKLWGDRSRFDRDFESYGNVPNSSLGINLGKELNTLTYIVSAGVPLAAQQLFDRQYRVINPMYVSGGSSEPGYAGSVGMLSSYPLSSYNSNWGWGLYNDVNGTDIIKYYNFHDYISVYNNVQVEGVIDWQNPYTNIDESLSSIGSWTKDGGYVESMIDYELRKGLGLFHTTLSSSSV